MLTRTKIRVTDLEFLYREELPRAWYFRQAKPVFENGHHASVLHRREMLVMGPFIYEIWASDQDEPIYPLSEAAANIELARIQALPTNRLLLTYKEEHNEDG